MRVWLAVLIAVATLVGGCARIATDGPVVPGGPAGRDAGLRALVPGPPEGASPRQIVEGFLQAAISARADYEVARAFLTPEQAAQWRPSTQTLVYTDRPKLRGMATGENGEITVQTTGSVTIKVSAVIDADGRMVDQVPAAEREVEIGLALVEGEWRLDRVPNLTMISAGDLEFVFSSYPVYFLEPTRSFLVPDPRWVPDTSSAPTRLSALLLDGPSDYLRGAVQTAFPAGTSLAPPSGVRVENGVAIVDLTVQARKASPGDRGLMRAQLVATLEQVIAVDDVELTVDNGLLDVPIVALRREPALDSRPTLLRDEAVMTIQAGRVSAVEKVPGLGGLDATAVAVDYTGTRYAVLTDAGTALRVLGVDKPFPDPVLTAPALTAPSFDWQGWTWSTQAACTGEVTALSKDGAAAFVDAPWLAGRTIQALRVSREGSRVAVVSSGADGLGRLDVAGVHRAGDGTPQQLTVAAQPLAGADLVDVREVTWAGPVDLMVIGRGADDPSARVILVTVGGAGGVARTPVSDPVGISVGDGPSKVLVTTADGHLLALAGAQWVQVADGVLAAVFAG